MLQRPSGPDQFAEKLTKACRTAHLFGYEVYRLSFAAVGSVHWEWAFSWGSRSKSVMQIMEKESERRLTVKFMTDSREAPYIEGRVIEGITSHIADAVLQQAGFLVWNA